MMNFIDKLVEKLWVLLVHFYNFCELKWGKDFKNLF